MSRNISLPRQMINAMLRPFGWCIGRVIWTDNGAPLTGLLSYRLLQLRREGWGGDISSGSW